MSTTIAVENPQSRADGDRTARVAARAAAILSEEHDALRLAQLQLASGRTATPRATNAKTQAKRGRGRGHRCGRGCGCDSDSDSDCDDCGDACFQDGCYRQRVNRCGYRGNVVYPSCYPSLAPLYAPYGCFRSSCSFYGGGGYCGTPLFF